MIPGRQENTFGGGREIGEGLLRRFFNEINLKKDPAVPRTLYIQLGHFPRF